MAGDDVGSAAAEVHGGEEAAEAKADAPPKQKQKRGGGGFLSRLWRGIFGGLRSEDYEKRLKYLSKEEDSVHTRMKRRAHSTRWMVRNLIVLSLLAEVVAVIYAIITTRSLELTWQMRAIRLLPMFVLPALAFLLYSSIVSFTRLLNQKDQKTLEKLRAERKEKIDELKERTNYYTTQQLIQKYDLDPAAKAAAATVLASKLGADSGLKFHVDEPKNTSPSANSSDIDLVQSSGLRNRKASHTSSSQGSSVTTQTIKELTSNAQEAHNHQNVVEHYKGSPPNDGGWVARIAALLVGEDPSQCYALICGNCHMHNGLARKEDFLHVKYYCPHCHVLNASNASQLVEEQASDPSPERVTPPSSDASKLAMSITEEIDTITTEQDHPVTPASDQGHANESS